MFYIYKITNTINNKIYVGQTNNFNRRWSSHKSSARNNPKSLIDSKIKEYGEENFRYELIKTCDTLDEANIQEEQYIKILASHVSAGIGYNIDNGGKVNKTSDETRQKLSESHLGHIVKQETKNKISESMLGDKNHYFGKKHSEETLSKMKRKSKEDHNWFGKRQSKESVEKARATMKSKHAEFCSIECCGKEYYSKGYCHNHYNQFRIRKI